MAEGGRTRLNREIDGLASVARREREPKSVPGRTCRTRRGHADRRLSVSIVLSILVAALCGGVWALVPNVAQGDEATSALASLVPDDGAAEGTAPTTQPTAADYAEAVELGERRRAEEAAEGLEEPTHPLDSTEALAVAEEAFATQLESAAGIFTGLEVEKLLSPYAAVAESPGFEGSPAPPGPGAGGNEGPVLLESSVPLSTPDALGATVPVDLSLEEDARGTLTPTNPLTEVSIPAQLGEGVWLPGAGVALMFPESSAAVEPTIADESVAFYPNAGPESDLAVSPTPAGVETFSILRTEAAPRSTEIGLAMDAGEELRAVPGGGARVLEGAAVKLEVLPPVAVDADGRGVPTSLTVEGDSLTVTAEPDAEADYPILVDPEFIENFDSSNGSWSAINAWAPAANNPQAMRTLPYSYAEGSGRPGLDMDAGYLPPGPVEHGSDQANWNYYVPRYFSDYSSVGVRPSTYIARMGSSYVDLETFGDHRDSPELAGGIWEENVGWVQANGIGGTQGDQLTSWYFTNPENKTGAKNAGYALIALEEQNPPIRRNAYIDKTFVEVADNDYPTMGTVTGPSSWVGQTAKPITYQATDTGLGVAKLTIDGTRGGESEAERATKIFTTQVNSNGTTESCLGTVLRPCPRQAGSAVASPNVTIQPTYNPAALPTGELSPALIATDPVGHTAAVHFILKIDHTAPVVALSGSLTEQAELGTERGSYVLKVAATDGSAAAPQSGVVRMVLKDDAKQLGTAEQACPTKNCALTHSFTVTEEAVGSGAHTLEAVVEDAVGNKSVAKLPVTFTPDHVPPAIELSGPLATAPKGWIAQKSYEAAVRATDRGRGVGRLTVQLDGTTVASKEQSCAAGGCALSAFPPIDATTLSGGSHELIITAEDTAGNVATAHKTLRVDPTGTAAPASVTRALKASEETGAPTTVGAPREEAALEGTTAGLELEEAEGAFEAKNPAIPLQVSSSAAAGLTVTVFNTRLVGACHGGAEEAEESAQEAEICENAEVGGESYADEIALRPTSSATNASPMNLENGNATLSTNTQTEQDTLIRPLYEGAIDYQILRSSHAPASATWTLGPIEGLHLSAIDARHVEVVDGAGRATLTLATVPATDATGQSVPTRLEINGSNRLSLTAEVPTNAVYPVVAGLAIRGGTLHIEAEGPRTEAELHREEERVEGEIKELEQMEREGRRATRGPNYHNAYTTLEIARMGPPRWRADSNENEYEYEFSHCNWGNTLPESWVAGIGPHEKGTEAEKRAWEDTPGNCIKDTRGKKFDDAEILRGTVHFLRGQKVWFTESDLKNKECPKVGPEKPAMVHCYVAPQHSKTGITVGANYRRRPLGGLSVCETVYAHINANKPYKETFEPINSYAGSLKYPDPEKCDWPSR